MVSSGVSSDNGVSSANLDPLPLLCTLSLDLHPPRADVLAPGEGPDAAGPVITEAVGGDRVPGLLTDLKRAGHHPAPACKHLAVVIGEIGMLRGADLRHGAAV